MQTMIVFYKKPSRLVKFASDTCFAIIFVPILFLLASCVEKSQPLVVVPSRPVIWLANGSLVNFKDLYELGGDLSRLNPGIYKAHANTRTNSSANIRFEGFLDSYHESSYQIPNHYQPGKCLSPEAEWLIFFPSDTRKEINTILSSLKDLDDESLKAKVRRLRVELRGMIEGKWLDVLRDESRKPNWKTASGKNNVASSTYDTTGLVLSIGDLDNAFKVKSGNYFNHEKFPQKIEISRRPKDSLASTSQDPIYYSTLSDLLSSALIKPFLEADGEPVLAITEVVLRKIAEIVPIPSEVNLAGINLSAQGDYAALVNSPARRKDAKNNRWLGIQYAIRYLTMDKPRIGMRIITEKAVKENDERNCLEGSEEYVLYLYGADPNSAIGEATLRLVNQ